MEEANTPADGNDVIESTRLPSTGAIAASETHAANDKSDHDDKELEASNHNSDSIEWHTEERVAHTEPVSEDVVVGDGADEVGDTVTAAKGETAVESLSCNDRHLGVKRSRSASLAREDEGLGMEPQQQSPHHESMPPPPALEGGEDHLGDDHHPSHSAPPADVEAREEEENNNNETAVMATVKKEDEEEEEEGLPASSGPQAAEASRHNIIADRHRTAAIAQLRHTLLSIYPPALQAQLAPVLEHQQQQQPSASPGEGVKPSSRSNRVTAHHATTQPSASASSASATALSSESLEELLNHVSQDKMYVHGAWCRYREDLKFTNSKEGHAAEAAATKRMQKGTKQTSGDGINHHHHHNNPKRHGKSVYTVDHAVCDLPSRHFCFKPWEAPVTTEPSLHHAEDKDEGYDTNASSPSSVPMEEVLSADEQQRYARYGMSSGRLRHECVEPFQFLSKRVAELRRQLLEQ